MSWAKVKNHLDEADNDLYKAKMCLSNQFPSTNEADLCFSLIDNIQDQISNLLVLISYMEQWRTK